MKSFKSIVELVEWEEESVDNVAISSLEEVEATAFVGTTDASLLVILFESLFPLQAGRRNNVASNKISFFHIMASFM